MCIYIYTYHLHTYRAHFHIVLQSFLLFLLSCSCSCSLCLTSVPHLSPFLSFTRASFFICHSHSLIFCFNHSLTHHFLSNPSICPSSLCVLDISEAPLSFFPYIYITAMEPVVLILKHHWKQAGYKQIQATSFIYIHRCFQLTVCAGMNYKKKKKSQAARARWHVSRVRCEKEGKRRERKKGKDFSSLTFGIR